MDQNTYQQILDGVGPDGEADEKLNLIYSQSADESFTEDMGRHLKYVILSR